MSIPNKIIGLSMKHDLLMLRGGRKKLTIFMVVNFNLFIEY